MTGNPRSALWRLGIHCQPQHPPERGKSTGDFSRRHIQPAQPGYRAAMADDKKTHTPRTATTPNWARLPRAEAGRRHPAAHADARDGAGRPATDGGLVRLSASTPCVPRSTMPRKIRRMLVTRNAMERLGIADVAALSFAAELVEPRGDRRRSPGQRRRAPGRRRSEAEPLRPKRLSALGDARLVASAGSFRRPRPMSAVVPLLGRHVFGAGALITTSRHSPQGIGRAC